MAGFNPDEFLGASPAPSAPPSPSPQNAGGGAAASSFDVNAFLNEAPSIDELTGEEIHPSFNGQAPETALNKSPLTALDRFKMSMGNQAGNMEYLKKRFDAVQPIMDAEGNPTSELAVMQNGKWHRIDAKSNWETKDPWELAKGYMSDVAKHGFGKAAIKGLIFGPGADEQELAGDVMDASPMIAGTAAGLATGGIAAAPLAGIAAMSGGTIGAGTVAVGAGLAAGATGAATAGARTSLGRVVGTYDATPEEQLWDIGFETILNAAGTGVPLGVKPTAGWVANRLPKVAEAFQDVVSAAEKAGGAVADVPKAGFKKLFSALSVGEDNFDRMIQHPYKVQSLMKTAQGAAGKDVNAYHDFITGDPDHGQIPEIMKVAQNTRATLTEIYGKLQSKILDNVPENFSANFDDAIMSSYRNAIGKGLGKVVTSDGKQLIGSEAVEYLSKNGLKNAEFDLLSRAEMSEAVRKGGELREELGYLASDTNVYDVVQNYYKEMGVFANSATRTGKEAAKQLMTFKKIAADKAMALANMEKVSDVPLVRGLINESRTAVDNSIMDALKPTGVSGAFKQMNETYSALTQRFAPILNANYRFQMTKDPKVYEGLMNQFLAKGGKGTQTKFAIDTAIQVAQDHGLPKLAKSLSNSKLKVQIGEAAKAFNPLPSEAKRRQAQIGWTAMFGAAASGNIPLAGVIGAGMAMRTPGFAKTGVALTQAAFKGQQMLSSLTPNIRKQFLENPQALSAFTNAIVQAPMIRNQVSDNLNSVMMGQGQQGQ